MMDNVLIYLLCTLIGVIVSALIYKMVFEVSRMHDNQERMIKTMQMVVVELRAAKQKYPPSPEVPRTGNKEKDSIIDSRVEKFQRGYRDGSISDAEYIYEMERLVYQASK